MKQPLHTFIRKAAVAFLLTAAGTLPMLADGTIPYRASFDNAQMRYFSKGEYSKIKNTDIATFGEIGAPALPVRTYRFVVPVYTGKFTVSITLPEKASETVTLDTPIMPVQRLKLDGSLYEEKITIDPKAYNSIHVPKAWVVDDYFIDGSNHIVTVAVMPVEYNPVASTMKYYPYVDIKLNYTNVAATEMSSRPIFTKRPDPNLDLSKIAVNGEKPRRSSYTDIGAVSAGTYIIISSSQLLPAFKELAEWKRNKGYDVVEMSLDSIYKYYTLGDTISNIVDNAGKVRQFLQHCYNKYGRSYVLLAGDYHTNFPIRYAYYCMDPEAPIEEHYAPSDTYFADMTGNWKCETDKFKRNEGEYGNVWHDEINYYADMSVGRLLCKNAQDVENYTRKLMLYERNPGLGDYSYLSKGFISFSNESPFVGEESLFNGNDDPYIDGEPYLGLANRFEKYIRKDFEKRFKTFKEMISNDGGPYYTGKQVLDEINGNYGFNVIAGHGQPHNIAISRPLGAKEPYYIWASEAYNDHPEVGTNVGLDNLTDRIHPSILFAQSCNTTPFDKFESQYYKHDTTLGAAYTCAGLYGGVSYIGLTRNGCEPYCAILVREFLKQMDNGANIGNILSLAKYNQVCRYPHNLTHRIIALRTALIGDPEMNIWTQAPRDFNITGGTLNFDGSATFNSTEIPGSMVTVSDGQKILSHTTSYFNTSVSIPYVNECCVTFTKPGCLPKSLLFIDNCYINNERTYFMSSGTISGTEIGNGGMVTIYASGDVVLDNSFKVLSNGRLRIITDGNVLLKHGMLDTGGLIDLKARGQIIINSTNFKIKGGSFLRQSHIQ